MAQRDILHKKYYDIAGELYEITSQLVVKAEVDSSIKPSVTRMKAYVQWSKNNLEPLEDAIESSSNVSVTTPRLANRSLPEPNRPS
jgi:hypothetical protein